MKNIVITGGAGGIGTGLVKKFVSENYFVYVIDKDDGNLEACGKLFGNKIAQVKIDVTDVCALEKFAKSINSPISHIVTAAGGALRGEWTGFCDMSYDTYKNSIDLNLLGHLNTIRAFLPNMERAEGDKSILMVSSVNGFGGFGLPAYSASKAALCGFMAATTFEFGLKGIRINVVSPGTVVTEATQKEPKDFTSLLNGAALGRFANVAEVAELAYRLCNDFTSVTGQNFFIDAGQSVSRVQ